MSGGRGEEVEGEIWRGTPYGLSSLNNSSPYSARLRDMAPLYSDYSFESHT